MKKITSKVLGQNSYILIKDNDCLIIDPGFNGQSIKDYISEEQLTPRVILLTHYHFDHVESVDFLCSEYGVKALIHENDKDFLLSDTLASLFGFEEVNVKLENLDIFRNNKEILNSFGVKVLHTPGHTEGTTCFMTDYGVFTGDFLFVDTIGRTDFPGSNKESMVKSLEKVMQWKRELRIYPGHGDDALLSEVIKMNFFLKGGA